MNAQPSGPWIAKRVLASSLLAIGLAGCMLPAPVVIVKRPPEAEILPEPPPPPLLEVPPPAWDDSLVWQDGYWDWQDDEYQWVEGCWVEPLPGYEWVAASYVDTGDGWAYRPPYWRHRDHRDRGRRGHRGKGHHGQGPHGADRGPWEQAAPHHAKVRAPAAAEDPAPRQAKVRAPAAPEESAPAHAQAQAPAAPEGPAPAPGKGVASAPATSDEPGSPATATGSAADRDEADQPPERVIDIHDAKASAAAKDSYKDLPSYRGEREGRPVFGDDPQGGGTPPEYATDATGAIVLSSDAGTSSAVRAYSRRRGSGRLVVTPRPGRNNNRSPTESARVPHRVEQSRIVPPPQGTPAPVDPPRGVMDPFARSASAAPQSPPRSTPNVRQHRQAGYYHTRSRRPETPRVTTLGPTSVGRSHARPSRSFSSSRSSRSHARPSRSFSSSSSSRSHARPSRSFSSSSSSRSPSVSRTHTSSRSSRSPSVSRSSSSSSSRSRSVSSSRSSGGSSRGAHSSRGSSSSRSSGAKMRRR